MRVTRRSLIAAAGATPLLPWPRGGSADSAFADAAADAIATLPAKKAFSPMSVTYLNSASTHPFSLGARRAVEQFLYARSMESGAPNFGLFATSDRVRGKFAALINAKPEEICLVQSTTAGEHLVVQALNIPAVGGRIVTDTLHFPESDYLYREMAKLGMDVVWLKPRDGRSVDPADVESAMTKQTRLLVLSLVSNVNGFQHDLKKVCAIAHAHGALVYADIIQAAGAVPIDVRDSNVDFAACASYKWLMGDFGLGFLYAREDLLDRIKRTQFGYQQLIKLDTHVYPFDPPGSAVVSYDVRRDATGHFATGTTAGAGVAQLDYSLDYLRELGVDNIQRYRQPLLDKARVELERKDYRCMTPEGSTSPILTFVYPDAAKLAPRLDAAKVKISLIDNRVRISASVFNDMQDIDRLIEALS
jgi:selenocysteine lyase/cysteine desulfurase